MCLQGKARGSDEGFDGDPLGTLLASLSASNPLASHAGGPQVSFYSWQSCRNRSRAGDLSAILRGTSACLHFLTACIWSVWHTLFYAPNLLEGSPSRVAG